MGFRGQEYRFTSPHEAVEHLRALVHPLPTRESDVVHGLVLGADVAADRDSPAFDQSSMDGFAVRHADLARAELPISGEVTMGRAPGALAPHTAMRITTGGAIPGGADTVLKREDVTELPSSITIPESTRTRTRAGDHTRRAGENTRAGATILYRGSLLTAGRIANLAATGASATVHRRVRVAILSTGDEITHLTPSPWQIRDATGPALHAMFSARTWCSPQRPCHCADLLDGISGAIKSLLTNADAMILCGGASMGDRDFTRPVLQSLGARVEFHGLPQRPGKPILAAILDDKPIFGLPGNPLSSLITCRRIVIPVLEKLAGLTEPRTPLPVTLTNPDTRTLDLWWHRLVRIDDAGRANFIGERSSGDVIAAARADGFLEFPPNASGPGQWPYYEWDC